MKIEPPRPLTPPERSLLLGMLSHAGQAGSSLAQVDQLEVIALCDCGCGSFELKLIGEREAPPGFGHQVADAYGQMPNGEVVGLILWGTEQQLTYMELYSLAKDPPFELPSPESITDVSPGWETAVYRNAETDGRAVES